MEWLDYWHWFALGLILVIAESLGAAGFLLAMGMAAGCMGFLMLFFVVSWQWQLGLFAMLCIAYAFIWRYVLYQKFQSAPLSNINRPIESMIGRQVTLLTDIVDGEGKIKVNDATWFVSGPDLTAGTKVKVVGIIDGTVLVIEPILPKS